MNSYPELIDAKDYGVITFDTTHYAVKAEVVLAGAGLRFLLIPTPRRISASCGMAVKCFWDEREALLETLTNNTVRWQGLHHIQKG